MAVRSGASVPTPASKPAPSSLAELLFRAVIDPRQRGSWIGAVLCLGLFVGIFWANLGHFYHAWTVDENYSHGFLVPLISLYFASQVARRGSVPVDGGIRVGTLLLLVALAGCLATIPVPIFFLADLSLLIGLAGLFALLFGTAALKRYWFAFFFLLFMVPLPVALYSKIASPLQLLASRVASTVMNASGVPVLCEGNKITLPGGIQMFVAEACSGMRQMTGFLALTTAVAYLSKQPIWYRVLIILSALPIAMTANIARVLLTGFIMHYLNPQFALGTYHTLEGLLMMGFGLLLLNFECWILDKICEFVSKPPSGGSGNGPFDGTAIAG
jgi:exosortase